MSDVSEVETETSDLSHLSHYQREVAHRRYESAMELAHGNKKEKKKIEERYAAGGYAPRSFEKHVRQTLTWIAVSTGIVAGAVVANFIATIVIAASAADSFGY